MRQPARGPSYLKGLLGLVLTVAVLYFAKVVLVPLALAILLTFVLTPVVLSMQRQGMPRVPAVLITVFLALLSFLMVGWAVGSQLQSLAHEIPNHRKEISEKIAGLRGASKGVLAQIFSVINEVDELPATAHAAAVAAVGKDGTKRTAEKQGAEKQVENPPVIIAREERSSSFEQIARFLFPVIEPLATAGLVLVLVVFILANREDLRNRLIGLLGYSHMTGTTRVLSDAADRISGYLLNQLLVNAGFAVVFSAGLYFIGVPYAILWGFLTGLLRFIPYIGSWLGAALPLLLTFAVFPGWTRPLIVLGYFAVLDLITANAIEPLLFGHTTGVSPLALLIAAAFWTWVWGPIGLLLSTPMTVCLVVLGQHAPSFQFLELLLGDRPPLPSHANYYQRLLARDPTEAEAVARAAEAENPETVYDRLFLPALTMTRRDRRQSGLTAEDEAFVLQQTREILDRLETHPTAAVAAPSPHVAEENADASPAAAVAASTRKEAEPTDPPVLILGCPAHHESEELSLAMLAKLMERDHCVVRVLSTRQLPSDIETEIETEKPALVFIAISPPGGFIQARYLCRRLRRRFADLSIVAGYWGHPRNFDKVLVRLRSAGANYVTTSLVQSRSQILALVRSRADKAVNREPAPARKQSPDTIHAAATS